MNNQDSHYERGTNGEQVRGSRSMVAEMNLALHTGGPVRVWHRIFEISQGRFQNRSDCAVLVADFLGWAKSVNKSL